MLAAYFGSKGIEGVFDDYFKSFSVNVAGYAEMVKATHQYFKAAGSAAIVNLASVSAIRAQPKHWYTKNKQNII